MVRPGKKRIMVAIMWPLWTNAIIYTYHIDVEHGSFTPLVFSTSGGMGNLACTFYKRLASLLPEKRREAYSSTLGWIRTHFSFSLLWSAIMCIRGARSSIRHVVKGCDSFDLVTAEAHIHESQRHV